MKARRIALIVGEQRGLADRVKAIGYRPVVAAPSCNLAKRLAELSPSFIVIDLPNGQTEVVRQSLLSPGTPIFVVGDHEQFASNLAADTPSVHILSRAATAGDLEAAIRDALYRPDSPTDDTPASRFSDEYLTNYAPLLSYSAKMVSIKEIIEKVADTNATILLRGETGVGKDIIARAVHAASERHARPFVKLNCAALPADLLESELFGHEKGAFTGAHRRKLGKFEFANHGTIFLDEIGELPLSLQAKLLHVLEDLQFSRIGGREMIRVDTRIVAATNRNLEAALHRGEFREDLFFRLSVVEIHVPPLRERREAILRLANSFLATFQRQYRRRVELTPALAQLFTDYEWPGNVRELENAVRRLVVLGKPEQIEAEIRARRGTIVTPKEASPKPPRMASGNPVQPPVAGDQTQEGLKDIARRAAHDAERKALATVLERVRWNRLEASRILKVSYKTLLTKISEFELDSTPSTRS